ncbi:MFS transporter [Salipiger pacificus]|uniref:MFS transporter n=1 Tax=Salipiger mangrovisoli TaxID=2865933 RepID=A0ABR9WYW3_9RHOB|nr:MFS transporter [Salipiger mangrovisoli]MBE9636495.1 MFS transporter [Salipiger mangrovisoli]
MSASSPLRRFILASGVTNLADGVAVVVWAWLATLLTRDPLLVTLMPITLRLPWFLFALPAGVITDRTDRRRLILCMDVVRACAFALAALAIWLALPLPPAPDSGTASPTLFAALLACALLVGTAEVFRDSAAQTMLPAIVPHDQLERANGRLWSVEMVGNALLGPAVGAFLIASVVWLPFALNAVCFLLAVGLMRSLRGRFAPRRAEARDWKQDLGEGLVFLRGSALLRLLAVITGVWNLLHQMVVIALVLHVQENLGLGASGYGLILAAGAVGGVLGGIFAERIVRRLGNGPSAQWMTLASALAFAALPLAPTGWALAAVLAAFEFCGLVWNTVSVSYRQRHVPDEILGRVNATYRLFAWGMMPLGLLLSGLVIRLAEAGMPRALALQMPFVAAAAGVIVLTVWAWRRLDAGFAGADKTGARSA